MDVHLHLLIHGMSGNPVHMNEAVKLFEARHPTVELFVPASISNRNTYDGIDWNAERVLNELDERIQSIEAQGRHITRFSVTGYSLGGLIARYAVGALFHRGFFDSVTPMNFTTFTTPHVGLAPYPHSSRTVSWMGCNFLGRSGKQLYCLDKWATASKPLLEAMAHNPVFLDALKRFPRINIYANAINDVTVPYYTGAFEESDPFAGHAEADIVPVFQPGYEPVLASFSFSTCRVSPSMWLRKLKPLTFNGPFIEWVFPWNLVLYILLPIIVLLFILYLPLHHVLGSRASGARVRRLEKTEVGRPTFASIFPVVDNTLVDNVAVFDIPPSRRSIMTEKQCSMIRSLNRLDVRKYAVFRTRVRNCHSMIICVDPRFRDHQKGRGVLRHWIDNFLL